MRKNVNHFRNGRSIKSQAFSAHRSIKWREYGDAIAQHREGGDLEPDRAYGNGGGRLGRHWLADGGRADGGDQHRDRFYDLCALRAGLVAHRMGPLLWLRRAVGWWNG